MSAEYLRCRQIKVFRYEQHLSERATEILKQMTELRQLRELVRLAEAAKLLHRPKGLARHPVQFESHRSVCRTSTARLASVAAFHVLTCGDLEDTRGHLTKSMSASACR